MYATRKMKCFFFAGCKKENIADVLYTYNVYLNIFKHHGVKREDGVENLLLAADVVE